MGNYLDFDPSTLKTRRKSTVSTSSGGGSAGEIPGLDSNGKLDVSFFPTGIGPETQSATASEALSAGDWVNFHDVSGTKSVRKANATDHTKPTEGFVKQSYSSSASATVYTAGDNDRVPVGTFVASDVGLEAFLSTTAGGTTKSPATSTGNLIQSVGDIINVGGTYVTVSFTPGIEIIA